MAPRKKPLTQDPEKKALQAKIEELQGRLADAEQHRDLLIQTFHGLSKQPGATLQLASAPGAAKIAPTAKPQTLVKLRKIISSYGKVPNPTNSTIVGPAVASMGQFTLDVDKTFGKKYVIGLLLPAWNVDQTGYYIDNNP
jgi:hypothetical protein